MSPAFVWDHSIFAVVVTGRLPLGDEARRKILWDNCARLYAIARPAAPLTRDVPQAAAAE